MIFTLWLEQNIYFPFLQMFSVYEVGSQTRLNIVQILTAKVDPCAVRVKNVRNIIYVNKAILYRAAVI